MRVRRGVSSDGLAAMAFLWERHGDVKSRRCTEVRASDDHTGRCQRAASLLHIMESAADRTLGGAEGGVR
jgi:hypothetical protein